MSRAPILPCLIANLQPEPTLQHPCASVLAGPHPNVTSSLSRRAISIPPNEQSGRFRVNFIRQQEPLAVPSTTILPCNLSKHIA
jgi:hypothetical protein